MAPLLRLRCLRAAFSETRTLPARGEFEFADPQIARLVDHYAADFCEATFAFRLVPTFRVCRSFIWYRRSGGALVHHASGAPSLMLAS